jgi:hypothetical protein
MEHERIFIWAQHPEGLSCGPSRGVPGSQSVGPCWAGKYSFPWDLSLATIRGIGGGVFLDLRKRYRDWMWRRLAFLLPSFLAALGVVGWLGAHHPLPSFLRIPCLTVAALVTALVGHLLYQILDASLLGGWRPHQESRALRRQLRTWAPLLGLSLSLLAVLSGIPALFPAPAVPIPSARLAVQARRPVPLSPSQPAGPSLPLPKEAQKTVREVVKEPEDRRTPESGINAGATEPVPVPRETTQGNPEIRPELALEPSHLVLDVQEPRMSGLIDIPILRTTPEGALSKDSSRILPEELAKDLPKSPPQEPRDADPGEEGAPPIRLDRELTALWPSSNGWLLGMTYRPLPDEQDTESWPFPEGRIEGFLLVGSGGDRVPGITLMLDLPLGRKDSLLVAWTGARLPDQEGTEPGAKPNWNHVTLGYSRRLAGYTRQATFDLAASLGIAADFLRAVEGVPDSGGNPKFALFAAIDLAFWQREPIGLLLHFSEAFPVTLLGSSLGMTDMSAQIRWDLSERVSLHGGYQIVLLRYKFDGVSPTPGTDPLREALTGPILGLDIRF